MIMIVETAGGVLVGGLVLIGAIVSILSTFGLIRLPDVYLRAHAATKSTTLGVLCILTAAFLYFWIYDHYASARLLLGIVFVFITAPLAGHLNVRSAYRTDVPLWERSVQDMLEPVLKGQRKEEGRSHD